MIFERSVSRISAASRQNSRVGRQKSDYPGGLSLFDLLLTNMVDNIDLDR
jgi:hypothetical protein